jgi:hypothetical protein
MASSERGAAYLDAAIARKPVIPRVWLDDARPNLEARYWIKGLIEERAFVVVYGPSGDGKTFWGLDAVCHIATEIPWRNRKVRKGLIVYVAAEAGTSIIRRFVTWRETNLGEAREGRIPLAIVTKAINLLDPVETAELIGQLRLLAEECKEELALVVFDTLARSMSGGDENAAGDMGQVIAAADRIRDELGAGTMVIHHTGKDPTKGARGSSALFAAADTVVSVVDKVATVEKSRDGISGEALPFELQVIELGKDQDGDPVTTCVVNQIFSGTPKRRAPTGKNQLVVWNVIREVVSDLGEVMPETSAIPQGVRAASVESVFARAVPKFPGIPAWRARDRVSQAMVSLQSSGLIGCHGDFVWLW